MLMNYWDILPLQYFTMHEEQIKTTAHFLEEFMVKVRDVTKSMVGLIYDIANRLRFL